MLQLYIGDGKGKTTAAFGLALRAFGRNLRVVVVQFLKGRESGEVIAVRRAALFSVFRFGQKSFVNPDKPSPVDSDEVHKALTVSLKFLKSGDYELVILDEVLTAFTLGLVQEEELKSIVDACPRRTELVMTGLNAPPSLISSADLVTEMKKIKHYYDKGIAAHRGIEY